MTKSETLIAAQLLEIAADQFSNHSCNDFDVPHTPGNYEFAAKAGDGEVFISKDATEIFLVDWQAMRACAGILRAYAEEGDNA